MSLLSSILSSKHQAQRPLVLLQSSIAQSTLPILQQIVKQAVSYTILCSFLYPPPVLLDGTNIAQVYDFTSYIPGYSITGNGDPQDIVLSAVKTASTGTLNVVIDSLDTLCSDATSVSSAYTFLKELMSLLRQRPSPSTLVLHVVSPSPILRLLTQTSFNAQLTHLIAHPIVLFKNLNSAYFLPPPPASPAAKFWGAFIPISERHSESDTLVFGSNGEGSGNPTEFVVEVIIRGGGDLVGRRKAVERALEGWSIMRSGPCELTDLQDLKEVWQKTTVTAAASDPAQNLSFNLNLTPQQQESRAQVPLPYVHEGKPTGAPVPTQGAIYYDPDSADDLDDDDPDEDLDI